MSEFLTDNPNNPAPGDREVRLRHGGTLIRPGKSLARRLGVRLGLAALIVVVVTLAVYIGGDGFADNSHPEGRLSMVDSIYYAATSLTTVGYGDIVPVSSQARLLNSVLLTPIRLIFLVLFFGTAYEVSVFLLRRTEERDVHELNKRLDKHTIICGYGATGRAAAGTLLSQGKPKDKIVIIDRDRDAVDRATADGLNAFLGDATEEDTLQRAAVHKAEAVLVAPGRDDAAVLICLTVNDIEPDVNLIAAGMEEENLKLLYQAGADRVISPALMGGRLMAAASETQSIPWYVEQLLGKGWTDRRERAILPGEAGKTVQQLPELHDVLVLGIARAGDLLVDHLDSTKLEAGDIVIYYQLAVQDSIERRMNAQARRA